MAYKGKKFLVQRATAVTGVSALTITAGGTGYTTAPTVTFTGGAGSGTTGVATVVAGVVTKVTITNPGTGYTSAPTVAFTGGAGTGAAATTTIGAVYETVGGMRTTGFTLNNEQVDITDKDGKMWKQLLEAAGVQSMSIKLAGVFKTTAALKAANQQAVDNTFADYRLISDAGDSFTGPFAIPSLERAGEYNKEETYSLTLDSAGDIVYASV